MPEKSPAYILLEEAPIDELASWMTKGLRTGDFSPVDLPPTIHRERTSYALRYLNHLAPQPVKDRLNEAMASAISSWTPEDGGEVLDGLSLQQYLLQQYIFTSSPDIL